MPDIENFGSQLPSLKTKLPGPNSQAWIDRLALRECPAITARRSRRAMSLGVAKDDPIVWKRAKGANIEDMDGNIFVDLTAGFGVAGVGHANDKVIEALQVQSTQLLHAMGDAFPDPKRIELLEKLAQLSGYDRAILGCSGSDSVEAAIKTARIATGRDGILAFTNAYHGLAFGSLSATHYKAEAFRSPFSGQLGTHVTHAKFGGELPEDLSTFAAIIVEPIQGRGGIQVPSEDWLAGLISEAHKQGTLVIFDEIYTGFGRTGALFAFQDSSLQGLKPDLLCVGKALGGGFPISACLGTATVMDSWGASKGEALHTQTFLGNPLGCAMGLAALAEMERILPSVEEKSSWLWKTLQAQGFQLRGRGMLIGIALPNTLDLSRKLMERGYISLPAGPNCEVLALTPPLVITKKQLSGFVESLSELVANS